MAQLIYSTEDEPALRGPYEQLSELKRRYDPENILHFNQKLPTGAISVSGACENQQGADFRPEMVRYVAAGWVSGERQTERSEEVSMAAKARDIMSGSPECVGENDSILDASKKLAKLGVGAMPICGQDDRLKGMLTDRDIVIKVIAEGRDPASTTAGELAQGKPVTIGADDSVSEAIKTMASHQVRRLPVIDGHELVGVISQADIARNADDEDTGTLVELISQP